MIAIYSFRAFCQHLVTNGFEFRSFLCSIKADGDDDRSSRDSTPQLQPRFLPTLPPVPPTPPGFTTDPTDPKVLMLPQVELFDDDSKV